MRQLNSIAIVLVMALQYYIPDSKGQLLERSLASVQQNLVLFHFQFAEHFYANTIYREQFHESMWRRLESIENNPLRKRSGDFLNPGLSWTSFKQPTLKISTTSLEQNKQYHFKVLLSSFHLNSHNLGSHPRTQMFLSPRE